jgi:hypothetical protein
MKYEKKRKRKIVSNEDKETMTKKNKRQQRSNHSPTHFQRESTNLEEKNSGATEI